MPSILVAPARSWVIPGALFDALEHSWPLLDDFWATLGAIWGRPEVLPGRFQDAWVLQEGPKVNLGTIPDARDASWERSWVDSVRIFDVSGPNSRDSGASGIPRQTR